MKDFRILCQAVKWSVLSVIVIALFALGTLSGAAPVQVEFELEEAAAVSLGVYDQDDRLHRTLLSGKQYDEGIHRVEWDGRDDAGNALPVGPYKWKALTADVGWDLVTMAGTSGKPPYTTPDGKGGWGGLHGNVMAVAADKGGRDVYLAWRLEEGMPALLRVNPGGGEGEFKIWGSHLNYGWGVIQDVATDGKHVYVANNITMDSGAYKDAPISRSLIWRVDAETGYYENTYPGDHKGLLKVSEVPRDRLPAEVPTWEQFETPSRRRSFGLHQNLFAIAVDDRNLYCVLRVENKIRVLNKNNGKRIRDIDVIRPAGLALAPDGGLYVLSESRLLKLSKQGEQQGVVVAEGLERPYGVCVDAQGRIYITDQAASMQVKVFDASGKRIGTVGKAGGRAWGGEWAKLRQDLIFPTHPAVSADGTLYVGEDLAPKRVAMFRSVESSADALKMELADEWIGPLVSGCGKMTIIDDTNPDYLYQRFWHHHMARYKIDVKKRAWALDAIWGYFVSLNRMEERQEERMHLQIKPAAIWQLMTTSGGGFVRRAEGRTFLFVGDNPLSIWEVDGYEITPMVAIQCRMERDLLMERVSKDWKSRPNREMKRRVEFQPWLWRDANGDWQAQEQEVNWALPPGIEGINKSYPRLGIFVDDAMNVYLYGYRFPFEGFDEHGVPVYRWESARPIPRLPMGDLDESSKAGSVYTKADKIGLDDDGDITPGDPHGGLICAWIDPDDGGIYHQGIMSGRGRGLNWGASTIFARLGKMDPKANDGKGRWLWMAGERTSGFAKPGQIYRPGRLMGVEKGCVFMCDWNGQARLFDKDNGLYVGSLFNDGYKGAAPGRDMLPVEFNEGDVITRPDDGEVYVSVGGDGCRLYRVTGLDAIGRFEGVVELKTAAVDQDKGAAANKDDQAQTAATPVFKMDIPHAPANVAIDGDLGEWNPRGKIGPETFDPETADAYHAYFQQMYDEEHLYLGARVVQPHSPVNTLPLSGFGPWEGDWVIARFSTDPDMPFPLPYHNRDQARNIDELCHISFWHNHLNKETYWDLCHGARWGDRLPRESLPNVEAVMKPAADGKGYVLEARVPWETLNKKFTPEPRDRIAMMWEITVSNGNAEEPKRAYKIYGNGGKQWSNNNPSVWGEAVFDRKELTARRAAGAVEVDSDLGDWPEDWDYAPMRLDDDERQYRARARAAWDDERLYLAYEVAAGAGLRNLGDDPSMAFKTGDTVEAFLSVNAAPLKERKERGPALDTAKEGDYRILMTRLRDERNVVFGYDFVNPNAEGQPLVFRTSLSASIDACGEVPDAEMAVRNATIPWAGGVKGFVAECSLPWAYFRNHKPEANERILFDLAVNFANPSGQGNFAKIYWSSPQHITSDAGTEAQIHPEKWGWLRLGE